MIKQTLYFGNPAKLNVMMEQLRISLPPEKDGGEERVVTRPIEDIGIVIVDSPRVTMTASVAERLMNYGAALLICDARHMPVGLMLNMEGHSLQSERFRVHLSASQPLKKQLWQQTVSAKIRNQAVALHMVKGENPAYLMNLASKVKSGDTENIEGRAASYYWRRMLEDFPDVKRQRDGDEPNSMLNYGYAIVRAMVARSLVASGLHPTLGMFHRNKYNAYCLADDVMEPYRPYVDLLVMGICKEIADATLEDKEVKRRLLTICTTDTVVAGVKRPMMTAIADTASSLYKCYSGELKKIRYPELQQERDV